MWLILLHCRYYKFMVASAQHRSVFCWVSLHTAAPLLRKIGTRSLILTVWRGGAGATVGYSV